MTGFQPAAWIVRPRIDPAMPPGTTTREQRAARLLGFMHRPATDDDDVDDTSFVEWFFARADDDEPGAESYAELAWMTAISPGSFIDMTGPDEEVRREVNGMLDWCAATVVLLRTGESSWRATIVSEEDLDRQFPGWREWGGEQR